MRLRLPRSSRSPHALALALALAAAVVPLGAPEALASGPADLRIDRVVFPVALADGTTQSVVGHLYRRGDAKRRTLQLVVHGTGFDHRYWDVPDIDDHPYSYARYMAAKNYAVLAIDLPGTGESSRPDGDAFGLPEAAECVHQVAAALREDDNPAGDAYQRIVLVGFSNGSVASIYAQGTYHDADALVTTGWVHGCRGMPVDPTDPVLAQALASPYVELPAFARLLLLFYAPAADPSVIAYDRDVLAQPVPRRQLLDLLGVHADIAARCADGSSTTLTRSQWVTGPVLVQAGDHDDFIAPASIVDVPPVEQSFYPAASDVTVEVVADTGHAFNLHLQNRAGWARVDDWIHATLDD